MSEYTTPSQAEGEREPDEAGAAQPLRTTPSQAEGDVDEESVPQDAGPGRTAAQRAAQGGKPGISQHLREEPRTRIQEEFDR